MVEYSCRWSRMTSRLDEGAECGLKSDLPEWPFAFAASRLEIESIKVQSDLDSALLMGEVCSQFTPFTSTRLDLFRDHRHRSEHSARNCSCICAAPLRLCPV